MSTRVVVEWTRSTVRLAVAEGRGDRLRIRAIRSQPVGPDGDVAEALRALLAMAKLNPARVIGVVPREQVITRMVKFPSTDPIELAQMVELYGKGQLPYPREQAVMDFLVAREQEGFSTVAIVACQREVVDRHLAILREAGLSPELVTVSSCGVLGWYQRLRRMGAGKLPTGALDEPVLVINVDDTRTDLALIGGGRLLSSRSIGQGAQDWGPSVGAAELLCAEAERSCAAVRKELPGVEPHAALLTGVGELPSWSQEISRRLGLPAVVVESVQPFGAKPLLTAGAISPIVVGGVAFGEEPLLNLSPSEVQGAVTHRRQVRELVTVSGLLLAVLGLGAGLLTLQAWREHRQVVQLDRVLKEVSPTARQVQDQTRSIELVGKLLGTRRQLTGHLAGIFSHTPADVSLEGVTFEQSRQELVVRGSASSTQTILDYLKQLRQLGGIADAQLKYTTRRSTPTGDRVDFELMLRQETVG